MQRVRQGGGRRADRRLADAARVERSQALARLDDQRLDLRRSQRVRYDVAGQAGRLAYPVHHYEVFRESVADALRRCALDLASTLCGLIARPTSWQAAYLRMRTCPLSRSTSTSAAWA